MGATFDLYTLALQALRKAGVRRKELVGVKNGREERWMWNLDHTVTKLDGQVWTVQLKGVRVSRPGKPCVWRRAGTHTQGGSRGEKTQAVVAVAWVAGAEVRGRQGQTRARGRGRRRAPEPRLFALCPAVARRVCAACHQLCTEEKCHAPHGKLRALGTYSDKHKTWPSPPNVSS